MVYLSRAWEKLGIFFIIPFIIVLFAGAAQANPKYAAIVVDANTGRTLYQDQADAPRHPASLTKMMTLYLLFDALDNKRVSMNTPLKVSQNATKIPRIRLDVKAGETISVREAIYALAVRSANDVAIVVAENLAGSEAEFVRHMNLKARQLGMRSTTFRNSHGLHDPAQVTTARDMALLAIALRQNHANHYSVFKIREFTFRGRKISGHNDALDMIRGADGLKTGYVRASGRNLVTSVKRGRKRVVAVVMGGKTSRSRDLHMASLIERWFDKASFWRDDALAVMQSSGPVSDRRSAQMVAQTSSDTVQHNRQMDTSAAYAQAQPSRQQSLQDVFGGARTGQGWSVQIGLGSNRAQAEQIIRDAYRIAPQVIAKTPAYTQQAQDQSGVFYRARFGPFPQSANAKQFCDRLIQYEIYCHVTP